MLSQAPTRQQCVERIDEKLASASSKNNGKAIKVASTSTATAKRMELKIFRTRKEIHESDDKLSAGSRITRAIPVPSSVAATTAKRASVDVGVLAAAATARRPVAPAKSKSLDGEPTTSVNKPSGIPTSAKILSTRLQVAPAGAPSAGPRVATEPRTPKSRLQLSATPRPARKFAPAAAAAVEPKPIPKVLGVEESRPTINEKDSSSLPEMNDITSKGQTTTDVTVSNECHNDNKTVLNDLTLADINNNDSSDSKNSSNNNNDSGRLAKNDVAQQYDVDKQQITKKQQPKQQFAQQLDQQIKQQNEAQQQQLQQLQQTSRGTNSLAHVSQTVHVRRKESAGEAHSVLRPSSRLLSLPSVYEEAVRFGADGAADARDNFVFLTAPEVLRVSATVPPPPPATAVSPSRRLVSHSTTSVNRVGVPPAKPARAAVVGSALELRYKTNSGHSAPDGDELSLHATNIGSVIGSVPALPKFPLSGDSPPPRPLFEPSDAPATRRAEKMNAPATTRKKTSLPADGSGGAAAKFADKLSRSFFDLTQGSHDRLLRWKTKLQQQYGGSAHNSSVDEKKYAPPQVQPSKPTAQRAASKKSMYWSRAQPPAAAATTAAGGEPSGQWHAKSRSGDAIAYPYRNCGSFARPVALESRGHAAAAGAPSAPRPLHSSHSASNALDSDDANNDSKHDNNNNDNSIYQSLLNNSRKFGGSTIVFPRLGAAAVAEKCRRNSTVFAEDRPRDSNFYDNKVEYDYGTYGGAREKSTNNIYKSNSLREDGITFQSSAWDRCLPSIDAPVEMEHRTLRQRYVNNHNGHNNNYCGGGANIVAGAPLKPPPPSATAFQTWRGDVPANENHLPPPARILPYSGIKPQDNTIIRPIAFRPIAAAGGGAAQKLAHRQSIGMELTSAYYDNENGQRLLRHQHGTNANGSTIALPSAASAAGPSESAAAAAYEHHRQTLRDQSRSIGNLTSMTGSYYGDALGTAGYSGASVQKFDHPAALRRLAQQPQQRSVDAPPPSASGRTTAAQLKRHASMAASSSARDDDAAYDTVPADVGRPRILQECNSTSSGPHLSFSTQYHSNKNIECNTTVKNNGIVQKTAQVFQKARPATSTTFSTVQQQDSTNNNNSNNFIVGRHAAASTTASISSGASSRCTNGSPRGGAVGNGNSKPKSVMNSSAVVGDRQTAAAAGLHITPSPSDSGIVDYETLIRDKEHELSSVRHAMEQNEEVLIRVYQEKERQFGQQIADLRQQVAHSEAIRQQLAASVRLLTEDRNLHQQRCQQVERELDTLRTRCQNLERLTHRSSTAVDDASSTTSSTACPKCAKAEAEEESAPAEPSNNIDSVYENAGAASIVLVERRAAAATATRQPPVPAPRCSLKESTLSLSSSSGGDSGQRELRTEVEDLRGEISSLRSQLNNQFKFFNVERQRWKGAAEADPPTEFSAAPVAAMASDVTLSGDRLI